MNKSIYQKTYLNYINIFSVSSCVISAGSCMIILNLLGFSGDLFFILSYWVGFLTTDYVRHKLNIDIVISFISTMIGFVIILVIIGLLNINS